MAVCVVLQVWTLQSHAAHAGAAAGGEWCLLTQLPWSSMIAHHSFGACCQHERVMLYLHLSSHLRVPPQVASIAYLLTITPKHSEVLDSASLLLITIAVLQEQPDIRLYKLDCNKKNKQLGQSLGVKVAPTFHLMKNGNKVSFCLLLMCCLTLVSCQVSGAPVDGTC